MDNPHATVKVVSLTGTGIAHVGAGATYVHSCATYDPDVLPVYSAQVFATAPATATTAGATASINEFEFASNDQPPTSST